jgi:uncharacterized membrane protein YebE (DUF533 family)
MADGLISRILGRRDEPPVPARPAAREDGLAAGRAMLRDALAAKVLHGWAQNRQQVLLPLTLNLARMEPADRGLLVAAMAAALAAGGEVAPRGRQRLGSVLGRIGGDAADREAAMVALDRPPDLFPLLSALQAASLGAHAYAASLMVLERGGEAGRAWLRFLAARFALPAEQVSRLARRYRG